MYTLLYKLTSNSSNKKFEFYLSRVDLEACRTRTWKSILILSSVMLITSKKMHILFYKLTTNSSNKKFEFLPVQTGPGGLHDQNLEADFNFFFRYDNSIQKDAYSVL